MSLSSYGISFVLFLMMTLMVSRGEIATGSVNEEDTRRPNSINEDSNQQVDDIRSWLSRRTKLSSADSSRQRTGVDSNWSAASQSSAVQPTQCHVEVQVTQRIPGQCIRLRGGRMRACRAGHWLSPNAPECT